MEEKRSTKIITIPNILSLFRFVLAFLFAWVYLHASTSEEYYTAALIIVVSGMTDVIDGRIARRFHMVSELGKILDPVADKFTQGILALCLMKRYHLMIFLVVLFLVKEAYMSIRGLMVLRASGINDGAKWYGKLNTVVLYLVMFLLIVIPQMNPAIANLLIAGCMVVMIFAWGMYARMYRIIMTEVNRKRKEADEELRATEASGQSESLKRTSDLKTKTGGKRGRKILSLFLVGLMTMTFAEPVEAWEGDSISVVALGDSIAKGYSGTEEEITCYSRLLGQQLAQESGLTLNYVNYAKNGLATRGLNERVLTKEDVTANLEQADIITVTIGANDLLNECKKEAQEILGTETKFKTADEALEALQEAITDNPLLLVKVIAALSSWDYSTFEEQWIQASETINAYKKDSAQVIVTNIYNPVANLELPGTMNKVVEGIIGNMNEVMADHQEELGYQLVDVFDSEVSLNTQDDGLHPNQAGQDMIAVMAADYVTDPMPPEVLEEQAKEEAAAKALAKKKEAQKIKSQKQKLLRQKIIVSLVSVIGLSLVILWLKKGKAGTLKIKKSQM